MFCQVTSNWLIVGISGISAGLLLPTSALAYVGPGAGLTVIGTILALIAAVLLAIVGFVWYPFKRMLRKRKSSSVGNSGTTLNNKPPPDD